MHHLQGMMVTLSHNGQPYKEHAVPIDESLWSSEYPENTELSGKFTTNVSQVAIRRNLDDEVEENITIQVSFPHYDMFAASVVRVMVCVRSQEQGAQKTGCRYHSFLSRKVVEEHGDGMEYVLRHPKSLPQSRQDDAISTKSWKTKLSANPGSITVFITRGHYKSEASDKNLDPSNFKPLRRPYGETYCFEFQCRPKGFDFSRSSTSNSCNEGHNNLSNTEFDSIRNDESALAVSSEAAITTETGQVAQKTRFTTLHRQIRQPGTANLTEEDTSMSASITSPQDRTAITEPQSLETPDPTRAVGPDPSLETNQQRRVVIDLTLDGDDEVVYVKSEDKGTGFERKAKAFKRSRAAVDEDDEDEKDEEDLQDQLREIQLKIKLKKARALKQR